jgi:hypothetical protein
MTNLLELISPNSCINKVVVVKLTEKHDKNMKLITKQTHAVVVVVVVVVVAV